MFASYHLVCGPANSVNALPACDDGVNEGNPSRSSWKLQDAREAVHAMPRSAQALVRPNAILDWSFKFAGGLIAPCPGQSLARFGALCILRLVVPQPPSFMPKRASATGIIPCAGSVGLVGFGGFIHGLGNVRSRAVKQPAAGSRAERSENLPSPDLDRPVGLANVWPGLPEDRSMSSSPDSRRKVCSIVCTSFTSVGHDCNIPPHDSRAPQWGRLVSDLNTPWQEPEPGTETEPSCT